MNNPTFTAEYETVIDAAPSAVFAALSEPEQIIAFWQGQGIYHTTSWDHDFRVGGSYHHTTMHEDGAPPAGQQFGHTGQYTAIDAPRTIEYTSKYDNNMPIAEVTTIRYEVAPSGAGKTHLRVAHSGFESAEMRDMHHAAWAQVFGWLNAYLSAKR